MALVAALGVVLFWNRSHPRAAPAFNIRTQVTFTGNAVRPALSADATQIAYVVQECAASGCHDGIEIQDVDGTAKRRLVDGASVQYLNFSPDRRFLTFWGTFGKRDGQFLVSTLGGAPRYLGTGSSAFLWGGDSLVTVDGNVADTIGWLKTEPLDGEARDSVRVHGLRGGGYAMAYPGNRWLLLAGPGGGRLEGRNVNRQGQLSDVIRDAAPQVGGDAAWFTVPLGGSREGLVRLSVDLRTGKFRFPADTVLDAASPYFDVSADGETIAYVEGSREQNIWVLPLTDALQGRFSPERRILASTSLLTGGLSPDGKHVIVEHSEAGQDRSRVVVSILPSAGAPESTSIPKRMGVAYSGLRTVRRSSKNRTPAGRSSSRSIPEQGCESGPSQSAIPVSRPSTPSPVVDGSGFQRLMTASASNGRKEPNRKNSSSPLASAHSTST